MNVIQKSIDKFSSIQLVLIAVGVLIAIISIIAISSKGRNKKKKTKRTSASNFNSQSYRNEILNSLPSDARLDYTHLYNKLSDLQRLIDLNQTSLEWQKTEAIDDIDAKIRNSQSQIDNKWYYLQKKQSFYHYIGLHYASFTLADSIKREQEVLRNTYVKAKNECDRLSREIDKLSTEISKSHGHKRHELMQHHKKLCEQHQRISKLKNVFGNRNTQYLNMVKAQNEKTRKYREYIIHNFGTKGRTWGQRLQQRKMDQAQ